ncbi:hypothetical protein RZS08_57230, partial [Arthrospira platensis SPKY1]|nr:hypothetical protein [Arthrospira platensis SPKY1]
HGAEGAAEVFLGHDRQGFGRQLARSERASVVVDQGRAARGAGSRRAVRVPRGNAHLDQGRELLVAYLGSLAPYDLGDVGAHATPHAVHGLS